MKFFLNGIFFFDHFEETELMLCQLTKGTNLPEEQQEKQNYGLSQTILFKNVELLKKKYGNCINSYFENGFNP